MYSLFLADDEPWIVEGLKASINWVDEGFELCGCAYNGPEAERMLTALRPDLALIDIRMPGLSGLEVIRRVKNACLDTRFVIVSGYAEFEYAREGIELSVATQGHLDAAVELEHLANRGMDTPDNRLYALSHAIYAAEGALVERARKNLVPRSDLLLGCNFFRYISPTARYAKFFSGAFDFATLPFYPGRTVPERGLSKS